MKIYPPEYLATISITQWLELMKPHAIAIEWFVRKVQKEVERKMKLHGKLEAADYAAAMESVLEDIKDFK